MTKRTYEYTITGTVVIDDVDLKTVYLGAFLGETPDPTPEQEMEESLQAAHVAEVMPPETLVSQLLWVAIDQFRRNVRPARHPAPDIQVVPQAE